jgi:hypothetical protein
MHASEFLQEIAREEIYSDDKDPMSVIEELKKDSYMLKEVGTRILSWREY